MIVKQLPLGGCPAARQFVYAAYRRESAVYLSRLPLIEPTDIILRNNIMTNGKHEVNALFNRLLT